MSVGKNRLFAAIAVCIFILALPVVALQTIYACTAGRVVILFGALGVVDGQISWRAYVLVLVGCWCLLLAKRWPDHRSC
jgi:hypothetical protein